MVVLDITGWSANAVSAPLLGRLIFQSAHSREFGVNEAHASWYWTTLPFYLTSAARNVRIAFSSHMLRGMSRLATTSPDADIHMSESSEMIYQHPILYSRRLS